MLPAASARPEPSPAERRDIMKQLPVLEPGDKPRKATWYILALPGDSPCARVGHSCSYLPPVGDAKRGKVFIVGGADPNRSFSDVHTMDLETRTWTMPEVTSPPPSPRTFHTSSAAIGNQLYVFGGGERGAQPVQDVKLHVFDASTLTWSQPETLGEPPSPRHGHVMVAVGTKLFIHGGLSGDKFYDDLHCIDISDMKWQQLSPSGAAPTGCAAHSAVAVGKHMYVFGGMTPTGALDTMYQYHIEKQHWTLLKFETFLPAGRLDHSMCIIPWPVMSPEKEDSDSVTLNCGADKGNSAAEGMCPSGDSLEESHTDILLCFVFGGMNTEGEIYDDCIVTVVD
ncbi:rab9 effector protein with kelch motifs isoform X2 [Talpa occidentalis]|uniref:rab9 effector protein with kelch motifs isoform X2 n=1 Tax=Talpa occidentalis TaxID=50954 RepID=UPI0023F985C6|nr:rab9 effector protein with kelch motifs isoform X2 [Talpa occidentalis]